MARKGEGGAAEDWIPLANKLIEEPDAAPNLLRRCIVSVMSDGRLTGDLREQFEGAVAICGNSLRESGRLDKRHELDSPKLTTLGLKRDRERKHQPDQAKKRIAWEMLIRRLRRDAKDKQRQAEVDARGEQQ